MEVERWEPLKDGELNEPNLRGKLESRGYRVARYVYSPGTYFRPMTTPSTKSTPFYPASFA